MENTLLEISGLSVSYDNRETNMVSDFSMEVKNGEIISIIGESGSGKTSIIRAIMGLLPPNGISDGEVFFQNKSIYEDKKKKISKDIAFVFQNSGNMLNPILTIGFQFVEYIRSHEKITKSTAYKMAVDALEKVNLTDGDGIMKSYPFELSGGMQQRVGIAMAIVFNPPLILADEPTSALDVTTQLQIVELLKEINIKYKTSIIIVTHNLSVASFLSENCIVLQNGKVVERGSTKEVLQNPQHIYTKQLIEATVLGGAEFE